MTRFRVLIAGGGVAALEALLALRELAGNLVDITLLAPEEEFHSRPLSAAEPFGLTRARSFPLREIARDHGAHFRHGGLAGADVAAREAVRTDGARLGYDALLVAVGARAVEAVPGALTFRGSRDIGAFRALLEQIERREAARVVFAVPRAAAWPLPLYELALMTAARARELGSATEISLVTAESRPLELFGARASKRVRRLLEEAGVALRLGSSPRAFEFGALDLGGDGRLSCDRVVALPLASGPEIWGLPRISVGRRGLLATDRYGRVEGAAGIYAAGDVTSFPVNQGGLAAQQADAAASTIAEAAGADVLPRPFSPVLRGALITGAAPQFLRAPIDAADRRAPSSAVAQSVLWWPPAKVAGRLLAPYLAAKAGYPATGEHELTDLEPPFGGVERDIAAEHEDVVALACSAANSSAASRDFNGALRWLEVVEDLELYLPRSYEAKRSAWQALAT